MSCIAVVMSGGAGTRLWPVSREQFPKQFHDLTGSGCPLMIETLNRVSGLGSLCVLTTRLLASSTVGFMNQHSVNGEVWVEPFGKNTAAAALLASFRALAKDPRAVVGLFPADHYVAKVSEFRSAVSQAFQLALEGHVVTLGVTPTYPATSYGYIETASNSKLGAGAVRVQRFVEKPKLDRAKEMIAQGNVLWNAGIFFFKAQTMIDICQKICPDLVNPFLTNVNALTDEATLERIYNQVPSISLDNAVIEKIGSDLLCIPVDVGWSDVGSWEEVSRMSKTRAPMKEISASNNFYSHLESSNKTAHFVGVSDLMIVDTEDALLVTRQGEGQKVKELVDDLKKSNPNILKTHRFEDRPWGRFEVLRDEVHFKVKKISVWPGQRLSYQSHTQRAEQWIVVRGQAQVTLNDKEHVLKVGESIQIPIGAKHRMTNPHSELLEFVEVQTGSYFGEDDIKRFTDDYGRG